MSNIATLRKFSLVAAGSVLFTFGAFEAAQATSFAVFNSGVNVTSGNNTVTVLRNRKNIGNTSRSKDFRRLYACWPPPDCPYAPNRTNRKTQIKEYKNVPIRNLARLTD